MKIWKRIQQLSIGQLWELFVFFLKTPLLLIPAIKATKRTFVICNERYGTNHNKSNKGNAFRHALWNVLICKRVLKITKNKQKSVFWTQKFTELYEKVTQNQPLDTAMDLHNNAIGRMCFFNLIDKDETNSITSIHQATKNAQKVNTIEEMKNYSNQLVYLVD